MGFDRESAHQAALVSIPFTYLQTQVCERNIHLRLQLQISVYDHRFESS